MSNHEKETVIGPKSKVPLYIVASSFVLGCLITAEWWDLKSHINDALTVQQAQVWIDNQRDANRLAYPSLIWTRVPPKNQSMSEMPMALTQVKP